MLKTSAHRDHGDKLLHLILADSELETIPKEISSDKTFQRKAQKRGRRPEELILDSNYYHKPMRALEGSERRGRPDIVQFCTMVALDTPLNREGLLDFSIHTRHDKILEIDPETRIPRSYNRFIGLMEQLFLTGGVPPENPLIRLEDKSLLDKVTEIGPDRTLVLSEKGDKVSKNDLFSGISKEEDICVIIGGFPHGEFISEVKSLADRYIGIYPEGLDAITALTHVIQFYEEEHILEELFPKS